MIVPEKIILLTSSIAEDTRATALKEYINSSVFGYKVIVVKESDVTCYYTKLKNKIKVFGIRHNINMLGFYDKFKALKSKKTAPKQKNANKPVGKYARIYNLVNRFNAKALFCMDSTLLYEVVKAKQKFNFNCKVIAYFDSYTFDKNTLLGADKYIVENIAFKDELNKMGIDKDKIVIKHFPVVSSSFVKETKSECKAMFDLNENKTIFINGGEFGDKKVVEIFNILTNVKDRFNVIVYLGENERLYQKLIKVKQKNSLDNVKLFTTINNYEKLVKASDLLISIYDIKAINLAKVFSIPVIVFAPSTDVQLNDFNYLDKLNEVIFAKDASDVVVKAFELTNVNHEEKNVDEIKSATTIATNYLIELLQEKDVK